MTSVRPAIRTGVASDAEHPVAEGGHLVGPVELADEHELVAAQPGDRVGGAHAAAQAMGGLDEHLVAGGVARGRRSRP